MKQMDLEHGVYALGSGVLFLDDNARAHGVSSLQKHIATLVGGACTIHHTALISHQVLELFYIISVYKSNKFCLLSELKGCHPPDTIVSDADCYAVGPEFESRRRYGCLKMYSVFEAWDTLNSHKAASRLVRLVEMEERWETPDHPRVFSNKIGVETSQNVLSPAWCSRLWLTTGVQSSLL
ncbi:hypothetical protein TNCV_3960381 [Trichonephila clavipes]|nr:hypothetical protein TNCV_3960381 [Trichonephila clavipes]